MRNLGKSSTLTNSFSHVPAGEFIRSITACPAGGYIDVRAIGPDGITHSFFHPDDPHLDTLPDLAQRQHRNLYFGCGWRTSTIGDALHVGGVGALWAEQDFKELPRDEARSAILAFALPASVIVSSGGGYHCYWLLAEPPCFPASLDHRLSPEFKTFSVLLRRLCIAIHGDLASAEPARILRPVPSINFKYDPARATKLLRWEPMRRYTIDQVVQALVGIEDVLDAPKQNKTKVIVPRRGGIITPIETFNMNHDFGSIIEPHGWRLQRTHGDEQFWCRPGKDRGISASVNYNTNNLFHCFSSNAQPLMANRSYNRFAVWTWLEFGGDFKASREMLMRRRNAK